MIYHYLDEQFGDGDGSLTLDEWLMGMRAVGEQMGEDEFEKEVEKWNRLLTDNQRKVWRNCFAKGNAREFVIASRAAGATHALFVVHGNCSNEKVSMPALATGDPDFDLAVKEGDLKRKLTDRGSAQCMVARDEWFGRLPVREMMISSPAYRTKETALYMAGYHIPKGVAAVPELLASDPSLQPLLVIEKLHPLGQSAKCEEIYQQKGDVALKDLLDADGGETAFGLYAESALDELTAKVRIENEKPKEHFEKATYVSVFGHSGFVNSVAYAVATAAGIHPESLDELLSIRLGEAEGILVPLYGQTKTAIHLKRPL